MSIINQVLKDLDRQGTASRVPSGVIAVDLIEPTRPHWPLWLGASLMLAMAATWWLWQHAPVPISSHTTLNHTPLSHTPALSIAPEFAPQLQLTLQLSDAASPSGAAARENPVAEMSLPSQTDIAPQQLAKASPRQAPPANIAFVPQPPRLDTRLPEVAGRAAVQRESANPTAVIRPSVVKEIKPSSPQVQAEEAWRQASRLLEQGRNHDARERLDHILRLDPTHAAARQSLIALALEEDQRAQAEALLREGLALHPGDAWYPRGLAQLHLQRGEFGQAANILKTALNKRADAANWSLYASTLAKLEQANEAAQAYREALRLDPTQGNWWIGMAVALERSGVMSEAGAAYQRALQTRLSVEMRDFAQQRTRELGGR